MVMCQNANGEKKQPSLKMTAPEQRSVRSRCDLVGLRYLLGTFMQGVGGPNVGLLLRAARVPSRPPW